MSGAGEGRPALLVEADGGDALPRVADVARRSPAVGVLDPKRSIGKGSLVGEAVYDVAVGGPQSVVHLLDVVEVVGGPVVFEIIDLPVGPLLGVGLDEGVAVVVAHLLAVLEVLGVGGVGFLIAVVLVAQPLLDPLVLAVGIIGVGADVGGIGSDPRGRVNAEFEPEVVHLPREGFHVGEFRVGLDGAVFAAARALPAVVDVDVGPAVVGKADATIARADESTCSCVTSRAQQFHEFQPIGGVSAIRSPMTMRRLRVASPSSFLAVRVTS